MRMNFFSIDWWYGVTVVLGCQHKSFEFWNSVEFCPDFWVAGMPFPVKILVPQPLTVCAFFFHNNDVTLVSWMKQHYNGSLPELCITFHLHYISFALHFICI